jgi:hypothetical protein
VSTLSFRQRMLERGITAQRTGSVRMNELERAQILAAALKALPQPDGVNSLDPIAF